MAPVMWVCISCNFAYRTSHGGECPNCGERLIREWDEEGDHEEREPEEDEPEDQDE